MTAEGLCPGGCSGKDVVSTTIGPLQELRSPRNQAPETSVATAGTWKEARVPADPLQLGFPCHSSLCVPWPELRSSRIPELCTGSARKQILPLVWGNGGKPTQPLREKHLDVSQKVIRLLWAPTIPLLSICPRETETCLLKTPAHTFKRQLYFQLSKTGNNAKDIRRMNRQAKYGPSIGQSTTQRFKKHLGERPGNRAESIHLYEVLQKTNHSDGEKSAAAGAGEGCTRERRPGWAGRARSVC